MPFIEIPKYHVRCIVGPDEGLEQRALGCLRHAPQAEVHDGYCQIRAVVQVQPRLQGHPPVAARGGEIVLADIIEWHPGEQRVAEDFAAALEGGRVTGVGQAEAFLPVPEQRSLTGPRWIHEFLQGHAVGVDTLEDGEYPRGITLAVHSAQPMDVVGDNPAMAHGTRASHTRGFAAVGLCTLLLAGCLLPQLPVEARSAPTVAGSNGLVPPKQAKVEVAAAVDGAPDPAAIKRLEASIESISDQPLYRDNAVELLVDGPAAYAVMLREIAGAKHHIHLETYIFNDDEIGRKFAYALI